MQLVPHHLGSNFDVARLVAKLLQDSNYRVEDFENHITTPEFSDMFGTEYWTMKTDANPVIVKALILFYETELRSK